LKRLAFGAGFAVALAVLLGVVASLGHDDSSGTAEAETVEVVDLRGQAQGDAYPEVDVTVLDNTFNDRAIRVDAGVTVAWTNNGRVAHDIAAVDATRFDGDFGVEAADFEPRDAYEFRFDEPGVYRYYCSLHGSTTRGMTGMVAVGDVDVRRGDVPSDERTASGTVRVPADFPTIQAAVDAAKPGALVLVSPGVYEEAVTVTSDDIVIRGVDRNTTILDGGFERDNGFKVLANGVAIENITARNYTANGFFWTGVTGYRGSYLTAWRNGDYGVYAFDSTKGQFEHSYAAGSPDAGFYIGQCDPCDALIDDVVAEWNGLGYSGTNAGGNLLIVNSQWHDNRVGVVPNSGTGEKLYPQHSTTIVGNVVHDNNNVQTAAIDIAQVALGNGILLAGGNENLVERNLVYAHDIVGIGITPSPETVLSPDNENAIDFDARRNVVRDNVVRDSGAADLAAITTITDAKDGGGNCFAGNMYSTTLPVALEQLLPCDGPQSPDFETDLGRFAALLLRDTPGAVDYRQATLPPFPTLENMPDAQHAPARSANRNVPARVDLDAIVTPAG
jgi:plastocyanin